MLSEELPGQVERLVDHLRKNKDSQISLTDVASVTEVLIGSMQAFFASIDTSLSLVLSLILLLATQAISPDTGAGLTESVVPELMIILP